MMVETKTEEEERTRKSQEKGRAIYALAHGEAGRMFSSPTNPETSRGLAMGVSSYGYTHDGRMVTAHNIQGAAGVRPEDWYAVFGEGEEISTDRYFPTVGAAMARFKALVCPPDTSEAPRHKPVPEIWQRWSVLRWGGRVRELPVYRIEKRVALLGPIISRPGFAACVNHALSDLLDPLSSAHCVGFDTEWGPVTFGEWRQHPDNGRLYRMVRAHHDLRIAVSDGIDREEIVPVVDVVAWPVVGVAKMGEGAAREEVDRVLAVVEKRIDAFLGSKDGWQWKPLRDWHRVGQHNFPDFSIAVPERSMAAGIFPSVIADINAKLGPVTPMDFHVPTRHVHADFSRRMSAAVGVEVVTAPSDTVPSELHVYVDADEVEERVRWAIYDFTLPGPRPKVYPSQVRAARGFGEALRMLFSADREVRAALILRAAGLCPELSPRATLAALSVLAGEGVGFGCELPPGYLTQALRALLAYQAARGHARRPTEVDALAARDAAYKAVAPYALTYALTFTMKVIDRYERALGEVEGPRRRATR